MRRRAIGQILLLAAGLVVLTVISAGSVHLVNLAREDARAVVHTVEVENQISLVQLQLRRAESAQRGYLSTLVPDFQTDFEGAASLLTPALVRLGRLTSDNPAQQRVLDEMLPLAKQRIEEFRKTIDLARTQHIDDAAQMVREGIGRDAMKHIDDLASQMRTEEDRLFAQRTTSADRSQTLAASLTGIGSGFVVVLAGISILLVRRDGARARRRRRPRLRDNNLNLGQVDGRRAHRRSPRANEEIQRFAYIVSHDLRSPLVNIMGFTSELEELRKTSSADAAPRQRAAPAEPTLTATPSRSRGRGQAVLAEFDEALGFIKTSTSKMDRLINAILNCRARDSASFEPVRVTWRPV